MLLRNSPVLAMVCLLSALACQRRAPTAEPKESRPAAKAPAKQAVHLGLRRGRPVATVDGHPIYEGDLQQRLLLLASGDSRSDALASLVDEAMTARMVEQLADARGLERLYDREDPDPLMIDLAQRHDMTLAELRAALDEQGTSWEVVDGFVNSVNGEFAILEAFSIEPASEDPNEQRRRDEVFSCLRMASDVDIADAELALPTPIFPVSFTVDDVDFVAPPGFDLGSMRKAYAGAVVDGEPLCNSLLTLAPALTLHLSNLAYDDADVDIDWPSAGSSPAVVRIAVEPGPRFTLEEVSVDLAAEVHLPATESEATLRRVRAAFVGHRDVGQHAELVPILAGIEAATTVLLDEHPDLSLGFKTRRIAPTAFGVTLSIQRRTD